MESLKRLECDKAKINNENINENINDIIRKIRGRIKAIPLHDSKGTFPLKKYKGHVEMHGVTHDDISTIDRVELYTFSETLWAKTINSTTFISVSGQCDLHYIRNGTNMIHKLKPGYPKRLKQKETPFALSSIGATCRLF
jgi:hypothetical protein